VPRHAPGDSPRPDRSNRTNVRMIPDAGRWENQPGGRVDAGCPAACGRDWREERVESRTEEGGLPAVRPAVRRVFNLSKEACGQRDGVVGRHMSMRNALCRDLWNPDRGSGRLWDRVPGVPLSRNPRLPSGTPSGTTCRDRGGLYRHAKPCRTWGSCRGCRLSDSDRSGHFRPLSPDVEDCGSRGGSSGKGDNDDDLPAVGAANPPDL